MECAASILQNDRTKCQSLIESRISVSDFVNSLSSIPKPESCPNSNMTVGKVCNSQQSSRSASLSCDFIVPPILPSFKVLKRQGLRELKTSTSSSVTEPTLLKSQDTLDTDHSSIPNLTLRPEPAAQLEIQETSAVVDPVQDELIEGNAEVGIPTENPPSSLKRGLMSLIGFEF
jgi:hypothetical protein